MAHYLLSMYQPEGDPPPEATLARIMADVAVVNEEMKAAGVWVFADGLHPARTATVLRMHDDDVLVTDGPFVEGKEHLGGCYIIDAADLDAALAWARKVVRVTSLPIEVRPFQDRAAR